MAMKRRAQATPGLNHQPKRRGSTLAHAVLAAILLAGTGVAVAQTGAVPTGQLAGQPGTSPSLTLSAGALDFGSVRVGSVRKLSFTVQNVGDGIFTGTPRVSSPFSILAGSPCVLEPAQAQVITVQYAPTSTGLHMAVVHLPGSEGATVTVMGSAAPPLPAPARRPRVPTDPPGLRLIAQR